MDNDGYVRINGMGKFIYYFAITTLWFLFLFMFGMSVVTLFHSLNASGFPSLMIIFALFMMALSLLIFYSIWLVGKSYLCGISINQGGMNLLMRKSLFGFFQVQCEEKKILWADIYDLRETPIKNLGKGISITPKQGKKEYYIVKGYFYHKDYEQILSLIKQYYHLDV